VNLTEEVRDVQHQFSPDLEDRIHAKMASGQYASEDDLFRTALDTLDSVETEARGLQAAIDAVKGGDAPVALDAAFSALRQKYHLPTDA
jgi:Arc/MetJ-type ribon-helix-helix transcriptional regulator